MKFEDLPKKFQPIWNKSLPYLEECRPGDDVHAKKTAKFILNYEGKKDVEKDILVPVAIMHDIGHAAILNKHFKHVTGPEKLKNSKLVHMLTGAKIAQRILDEVSYDKDKSEEIVDIISIHDMDKMEGVDREEAYDTENKRVFNDMDALDRYTVERVENVAKTGYTKKQAIEKYASKLDSFFYDEFRKIAENRLKEVKEKLL